jgi:hypothetical protein
MGDTLGSLLSKGAGLEELAALSDSLALDERVAQMRALAARCLGALYDRAAGQAGDADLAFFHPAAAEQKTVEWIGKNSLPAFSHFSKRFTRSAESGRLTGHNTGSMQWLVGPGYFTAVARPEVRAEFLFDYTQIPSEAPAGWPELKPNEAGLSRLVFHDMHDYFRPVGRHLGIGGAYNSKGKFKGQYFALARGETLSIGR